MSEAERLARYVAGEMSAAEVAALEREAATDAPLGARVRAARAAWSGASAADVTAVDVDAAWRHFAMQAAIATSSTPATDGAAHTRDVLPLRRQIPEAAPAAEPPRRARLTDWRAAAVVLVVLASVLVWSISRSTSQVVATSAGEQRVHTLDDGSEVRLGPLSRLIIRAGYGVRHRTVELAGEALFHALPDAAAPFVVELRRATVRDIGSAFLVRALDSAGSVDVIVTDGSAWLGLAGATTEEGVLLHGGQHGRLDAASDVARVVGLADIDAALAWTRGRLVFADATLADVALQLRRWYGIEVQFPAPQLRQRRLSAAFEGERLDEVLASIARTLDVQYRRDGDVVVFSAAQRVP